MSKYTDTEMSSNRLASAISVHKSSGNARRLCKQQLKTNRAVLTVSGGTVRDRNAPIVQQRIRFFLVSSGTSDSNTTVSTNYSCRSSRRSTRSVTIPVHGSNPKYIQLSVLVQSPQVTHTAPCTLRLARVIVVVVVSIAAFLGHHNWLDN